MKDDNPFADAPVIFSCSRAQRPWPLLLGKAGLQLPQKLADAF